MKLIALFLLCTVCVTMSEEVNGGLDFFSSHPNIEWVVDTAMNGTAYIAEELHSFELNKVRARLTSYDPQKPAFDMMFDYNEGYMLFYYNLTGDCRVLPLEKKDLTAYYKNIMENHTEYAGKRGHLDLFEVKEPDVDARTWVYGFWSHHDEHNHSHFVPVRMQFHNPVVHTDYEYELIDSLSFPKVSESDFDYPMCKKSIEEVKPVSAPVRSGFGVSQLFLKENLHLI